MKNACYRVFTLSILALACMSSAIAREPIQVSVTGGGNTSGAGFNDIESMVDSFLIDPVSVYGYDTTNPSLAFTAAIDILGFQMGLSVNLNELTLSFTSSNGTTVTHVVRGSSRSDMFDQLEDFFKSEAGESVFEEYVKAMQSQAIFNFISGAQSPVGESVRENTLRAMGESKTLTEMRRRNMEEGNFSIGYQHAEFSNEFFSGESTTVPIQIGTRLNQTADIQFRIPITWTDLDGTEFYQLGMELDLGIKLTGHRPQAPFECSSEGEPVSCHSRQTSPHSSWRSNDRSACRANCRWQRGHDCSKRSRTA